MSAVARPLSQAVKQQSRPRLGFTKKTKKSLAVHVHVDLDLCNQCGAGSPRYDWFEKESAVLQRWSLGHQHVVVITCHAPCIWHAWKAQISLIECLLPAIPRVNGSCEALDRVPLLAQQVSRAQRRWREAHQMQSSTASANTRPPLECSQQHMQQKSCTHACTHIRLTSR